MDMKITRTKKQPEPPALITKAGWYELHENLWYALLVIDKLCNDPKLKDNEEKRNKYISERLPKALGYLERLQDSLEIYSKTLFNIRAENDYSDLDKFSENERTKWIRLRKKSFRLCKKMLNDHRKKYNDLICSYKGNALDRMDD